MKATVWSKPACPYCDRAKNLLKMKGIEYEEKNIADGHKIQDLLALVPNAKTMPQIWLDEEHIGGYSELEKRLSTQIYNEDNRNTTNDPFKGTILEGKD